MPDYSPILTELHQNLNRLLEQETKFGDNAPLELIHQIADHRTAITLTEQARAGEIGEAGWREALRPLLVTIRDRSQANPDWGLSPEDLQGGLIGAIIAEGDSVTGTKQHAHGHHIAQAAEGGIAAVGEHIVIHAGQPYHPPFVRPPRARHFTDRIDELTALLAELQPGRVVTLCGPGGIGKTALAAEAIHRLAPGDSLPDRFPDGIYFYSFYNQPQAAAALEDIALAFGQEAKPTPQAAARRALANRRALLLLDGAEDADHLPTVLQVVPTCGVIITSRKHSDAPADFTDLAPLPPDEAVALLRCFLAPRPDAPPPLY